MTKYIYRYANSAVGYKVYENGFVFILDDKDLSVDEFREALKAQMVDAGTIESIVDDVYQNIREDALRQGWTDTAKLTIRSN